jgi:hypothetical protein
VTDLVTEQPRSHVVGHLAEGALGDVLAIDGSHVRAGWYVTHDVVHGHLVAGLGADRFERPTQTVEAEAFLCDARFLHGFLRGIRHRVVQHHMGPPVP